MNNVQSISTFIPPVANARTADTGRQGAPPVDSPKSWTYMHRLKWARALPVRPLARLTAVCIADHINEKTGAWILSTAQIADETGQGERTVRRHINEDLRAYFKVEDRPGRAWRFTMPTPMMQVAEPRPNWPDTPAKLADVPCKEPSKQEHTPRARVSCSVHKREWFKEDGDNCHECARERLTLATSASMLPARLRVGAPKDGAVRLTEGDRAAMARLRSSGWRKGEGRMVAGHAAPRKGRFDGVF